MTMCFHVSLSSPSQWGPWREGTVCLHTGLARAVPPSPPPAAHGGWGVADGGARTGFRPPEPGPCCEQLFRQLRAKIRLIVNPETGEGRRRLWLLLSSSSFQGGPRVALMWSWPWSSRGFSIPAAGPGAAATSRCPRARSVPSDVGSARPAAAGLPPGATPGAGGPSESRFPPVAPRAPGPRGPGPTAPVGFGHSAEVRAPRTLPCPSSMVCCQGWRQRSGQTVPQSSHLLRVKTHQHSQPP